MTLKDLQEKVRLAQENVDKIQKTIEKHKARKEKKIAIVDKLLEEAGKKERYADFKDDPNARYKYADIDKAFHDEFYWAMCDVSHADSDIQGAESKLKEKMNVLKNWKEKLGIVEAQIQYIKDTVPQIIKDFLNAWKAECIKYYTKKAEAYPEAYKKYQADLDRTYYDVLKDNVEKAVSEDREKFIVDYCHGRESDLREIEEMLAQYSPDGPRAYCNTYHTSYHNIVYFKYRDPLDPYYSRRYKEVKEIFNARFGDGFFQSYKDHKFDPEWLDAKIEEEKNNKLIDLMARVTKITGTITDAQYLSVTNGDLNGHIIGERGKAKIQTIGAGGYNENVILDSGRHGQCYHFRVLVNEIKEK